jgi:hypothetical protein
MRAYLQRTEVRISTIHRVAVGFLSGAGLLFLFPVFLKDSILVLIRVFLEYKPVSPASLGENGQIGAVIGIVLVLIPFFLSLGIPAAALLLLIKDTVRFYFIGHAPGFPEEYFNPRFVVTGVAFSSDESEAVKDQIQMIQYGTDLINFILPFDENRASDYSEVIDPERQIVPRTRKLPRLMKRGIVRSVNEVPVEKLRPDDHVLVNGVYHTPTGDYQVLPFTTRQRTVKDIDRFNAALGLAGFVDRTLQEEVAKQEVAVVRHGLKLRQLMFRYFQALLILLWTALATFIMLPFLTDTSGRFPPLVVLGVGYTVWSLFAPVTIHLPVRWLLQYAKPANRREGVRWLSRADGVERFENSARRMSYVAIAASVLALVIAVWLARG